MNVAADPAETLHQPYALDEAQKAAFGRDGFIKLKNVISPQELAYYQAEITAQVQSLNTHSLPLEQRGTYGKAFIQISNIWRHSQVVRQFVFSPRLAQIAADLLGCAGVRLYHDQALYKEPGGGITPWHADQFYWPLATDKTITVWVPLQPTPMEMGPLAFSRGSHRAYSSGREMEISDDSEVKISKWVLEQGLPIEQSPYDLGEVSYHLGWTYHRAGPNQSQQPRKVMTVIYFDKDAKVAEPKNNAQRSDWKTWLDQTPVGQIPDTQLTPILFPS